MAYELLDTDLFGQLLAGADLSTHQFKFVTFELTAGVGKVQLAATAGARVLGVLQDKPIAGQPALVAGSGISKVQMGSACNAGDYLVTTSAGLAVTTAATASQRVAQAMETSSGTGQVIAALLRNFGPNVP